MPNIIKLKKSNIENKAPLGADLEYGEIALNYRDGNIYYKNSADEIAEMKRLDARLDEMNITSMIYDGSDLLTHIVYESGNKVIFNYTAGVVTSIEYYGTDGLTLLFTQTINYNVNGLITSTTWSAAP